MAQANKKTNTPKQLQKSARAAEKEYNNVYGKEDTATPQLPPEPDTTASGEVKEPTKAPVVEITPPAGEKPVDWEQKYRTLDGKYTAEVPRLQAQNNVLKDRLDAMEKQILADKSAKATPPVETAVERLLNSEEIEDYGEDMISVVKRAAREEFGPELSKLREENEQLRGELGQVEDNIASTSQSSLFDSMDRDLPEWRSINTNPEFLDWLSQADVYSGLTRQDLLTKAFESQDTSRVMRFFRGFKAEQTPDVTAATPTQESQGSSLDTLVAPGKPKGSTDTGGARSENIWTEKSIAQFYRDVQKGQFKGRDPEKDALERDIFAAMKDGRIIG